MGPLRSGIVAMYRVDPTAVECVTAGDEILAFDRNNSRYLSLNRTAAELWPLLERGSTLEELRIALTNRWNVDDEQARADVMHLISWLAEAGMLSDAPTIDS
jgi:hypothetical protein